MNAAFEEALSRVPVTPAAPPRRRKPLAPEPVLMPMESAGRALRGIVAELAEDMSQPAARAGFCTSLMVSALLARRLGFVPTVAIAVMIGVSVEHLYSMAEDIHRALTLDDEMLPPFFHGVVGCRGHEQADPWTEECPDAPEPV